MFPFIFLSLQIYLSANHKLNGSLIAFWHWKEPKKSSRDICHPGFNRHLSLLQSVVYSSIFLVKDDPELPFRNYSAIVSARVVYLSVSTSSTGEWRALMDLCNGTTILYTPTLAIVISAEVEMGQLWLRGIGSGLSTPDDRGLSCDCTMEEGGPEVL